MLDLKLEGKTAIVTGASKGMGKTFCTMLADQGADIIGISNGSMEETSNLVKAKGRDFYGIIADLSDAKEVDRVAKEAIDYGKKIDILINNAGITKIGPTVDMAVEDFDLEQHLNVRAVYLMSQKIGANMIQHGGGRIVNVASIHGFLGSYEVSGYAASKHAVIGLTKALGNEWGQYGVFVNAVAPGFTMTDNTKKLREDKGATDQITEQIPLKRWATPEDIGKAVLFLASDMASYVNGHTLVADGGFINQ